MKTQKRKTYIAAGRGNLLPRGLLQQLLALGVGYMLHNKTPLVDGPDLPQEPAAALAVPFRVVATWLWPSSPARLPYRRLTVQASQANSE